MSVAAPGEGSQGGRVVAAGGIEKSGSYVEAPWRYEVMEDASHRILLGEPDQLSTRFSSPGCTDRPRPGN
jgi:hypothetical protein